MNGWAPEALVCGAGVFNSGTRGKGSGHCSHAFQGPAGLLYTGWLR